VGEGGVKYKNTPSATHNASILNSATTMLSWDHTLVSNSTNEHEKLLYETL